MTGIKENGIKHCYRADKGNTLLEQSLKALFIKFDLQKSKDGRKMPKMQMAPFFRKSLLYQLLHYLDSHEDSHEVKSLKSKMADIYVQKYI